MKISWAVCVPDLDIQDVLGFGFLKDKQKHCQFLATKTGKKPWMKAKQITVRVLVTVLKIFLLDFLPELGWWLVQRVGAGRCLPWITGNLTWSNMAIRFSLWLEVSSREDHFVIYKRRNVQLPAAFAGGPSHKKVVRRSKNHLHITGGLFHTL